MLARMGTQAVGAYLQTYRDARGYSRVRLAALVGTSEAQIVRIEQGEQDTRGSLLLAIVRALGASADVVTDLILSEGDSAEIGRATAQRWLAERGDAADVATIIDARARPDATAIADQLDELARRIRLGLE